MFNLLTQPGVEWDWIVLAVLVMDPSVWLKIYISSRFDLYCRKKAVALSSASKQLSTVLVSFVAALTVYYVPNNSEHVIGARGKFRSFFNFRHRSAIQFNRQMFAAHWKVCRWCAVLNLINVNFPSIIHEFPFRRIKKQCMNATCYIQSGRAGEHDGKSGRAFVREGDGNLEAFKS